MKKMKTSTKVREYCPCILLFSKCKLFPLPIYAHSIIFERWRNAVIQKRSPNASAGYSVRCEFYEFISLILFILHLFQIRYYFFFLCFITASVCCAFLALSQLFLSLCLFRLVCFGCVVLCYIDGAAHDLNSSQNTNRRWKWKISLVLVFILVVRKTRIEMEMSNHNRFQAFCVMH